MFLTSHSKIYEALKDQFEGKTALMLPDAPRYFLLKRMRQQIADRMRVWEATVYNGEAEKFILDPLFAALKAAKDGKTKFAVQQAAYSEAANYALIAQVLDVTVSRDVSRLVQGFANEAAPVITAIQARATPDPGGKAFQTVLNWMAGQNGNVTDDALSCLVDAEQTKLNITQTDQDTVWKKVTQYYGMGKGYALSRKASRGVMFRINLILQAIDSEISAAETEMERSKSKQLQVMDPEQDSDEFSTVDAEQNLYHHCSNAFTAMVWLLKYLDVVADYDAFYRPKPMVSQSAAFVSQLKQQAYRYRSFFLSIATDIIWLDLHIARTSWEEVHSFWKPVLDINPTTAYTDLLALWKTDCDAMDEATPVYIKTATDDVFRTLKTYVGATRLLPAQAFKDMAAISSGQGSDIGLSQPRQGVAALVVNDLTRGLSISVFGRTNVLADLALMAKSVEEVLSYVNKVSQIMLLSDPSIARAYQWGPEISWGESIPEVKVSDFSQADFKYHDPLQPQYEKYSVTVVKPQAGDSQTGMNAKITKRVSWKFDDTLMQPFFWIQKMQQVVKDRSKESRVIWQGSALVNTGDVLTADYARQPLLANFTLTRNAQMLANNVDNYLTIMSGKYGLAKSRDEYFRTAADIIMTDIDSYGRAMADMLIAHFFIKLHIIVTSGSKTKSQWINVDPTLPTVYGVPLEFMRRLNSVPDNTLDALYAETQEGTDRFQPHLAITRLVEAKEVRAILFGKDVSYSVDAVAFQMHRYIWPLDGSPLVRVIVPFAQKSFLTIPLMDTFWNLSNGPKLKYDIASAAVAHSDQDGLTAMENSIVAVATAGQSVNDIPEKEVNEKKVPIWGLAPYTLVMPHVLFDYLAEDPIFTSDLFNTYASVSVRTKFVEALRLIKVQGFVDLPVQMFTPQDREEAMSTQDPTPASDDHLSSADPKPDQDGIDPDRSEGDNKPAPVSAAPASLIGKSGVHVEDPAAQAASAARITESPIVPDVKDTGKETDAGNPVHDVQIKSPEATASTEKPLEKKSPSVVAQGDPQGDKGSADPAGVSSVPFWKKLSGGKIVDVIQADDAPNGYVPATPAEYEKFKMEREGQGPSEGENKD